MSMSKCEAAGISIRGISKVFGSGADQVRALDNVSLDIDHNEFFTLLGPSGCGKTTLLRLIAGFEQPTDGEILLDGAEIAHLPPFQRPVNTVFQSYALFPHMTVARNIAFGLEMQGMSPANVKARVTEMLGLVQLGGLEARRPAQLSGGQQQRVALARALANQPKVLLLDEPLSALDLKLRKEMQIELKRLQLESGITFVFVTHDQEEALTMSDRVAVMSQGHILQVGPPAEIYEHPRHRFVADFIGEINLLEATAAAPDGGRVRFRLGGAQTLVAHAAAGTPPAGRVNLAIRPERASLESPGKDGLAGAVESIVYIGADTVYRVALAEGAGLFTVRVQNRTGAHRAYATGDAVAVVVPPEAIQVLSD
jgi:spermidine/putrescine transport system ATP-binding protein